MKQTLFYLNVLAQNSRRGRKNLYILVESFRSPMGHISVDFMNLNTDLVVDVIDWQEIYNHATQRANLKWMEFDSQEPSEDDVISGIIANNQLL